MKKLIIFISVGVAIVMLLLAMVVVPRLSAPSTIMAKNFVPVTMKQNPIIDLHPEQNEIIGSFYFPKFDIEVPLVYGYNVDYMEQYFDELGLEAWGNFPGQNNKLYILGHRQLAFQNLKDMQVNDTIVIKMSYGEFTYQIYKEPEIVLANDAAAINFYTDDREAEFEPQILRLQTCYPFEAGSTLDHRYLVDLKLVKSVFFK